MLEPDVRLEDPKPETVLVELTVHEASLIYNLRNQGGYGKYIIHYQNGVPKRIEVNGSVLLNPEDAEKLKDVNPNIKQ